MPRLRAGIQACGCQAQARMEEAPYARLEAEEADQVIAPDAMLVIGYHAQGFVARIGSWYLFNFCVHGVACDFSSLIFFQRGGG
jgi:hypothetical protein